jgi:hypothetical protein
MTYVGPEPHRRRMCTAENMAQLLAGEGPHGDEQLVTHFLDVLGGVPPVPHEPIPDELRAMEYRWTDRNDGLGSFVIDEYFTSPASRLADEVGDIAAWFADHAPVCRGVDNAEIAEGLRRFATALLGADPDPAQLARDLATLGWLINRAYDAYDDDSAE